MSTPAVDDFTGDGTPDLLLGSNLTVGDGLGGYTLLDGAASTNGPPDNWPVVLGSSNLVSIIAEGTPAPPAAADLDGDGRPEGVFHGTVSAPVIVPADPGEQQSPERLPANALPRRGETAADIGVESTRRFGADSNAPSNDAMFPMLGGPALGDLDQDGVVDVVASGGSLLLAQRFFGVVADPTSPATHMLARWSGATGRMLPGSPAVIEGYSWLQNHAIADLNGDGFPEVIAGNDGYFVHALDACGREPTDWPKFTGQWIAATPAVGDIDGDDQLEVVVPTRSGFLFAWNSEGSADGVIAWESYHHDTRNTGSLSTPLPRGVLLGEAGPLEVDERGRCLGRFAEREPDGNRRALRPAGGCGCRAPAGRDTRRWGVLLAVLLPALRRRWFHRGSRQQSCR